MKKILIASLLAISLLNAHAYSQTTTSEKRFIEVTGSAEMLVQPDEIELEIVLTEYDRAKLSDIEQDFYAAVRKNNIPKESVTVNDVNTYFWWYWWGNRNRTYKTKTVKVLLKESEVLSFTESLNEKWVQSIRISDKKNKDIQKLRKDIKIEAVKAAKAKATYLLESIGEQIGSIISIQEMPENDGNPWFRNQSMGSNTIVSSGSGNDNETGNIAGIKLRYEVKAKFEIK